MRTVAVIGCAFCLVLGCSNRTIGDQEDDGGPVDADGIDAGNNNNNDNDGSVAPDADVERCSDDPIPVFGGEYQLLINELEIGPRMAGMDLVVL